MNGVARWNPISNDVQEAGGLGIVAPKLTTTQRLAISSPYPGQTVYDSTLGANYTWNGSAWIANTGGSGDVVGPASSVNYSIPYFNGTTGKLLAVSNWTIRPGVGIVGPADEDLESGRDVIADGNVWVGGTAVRLQALASGQIQLATVSGGTLSKLLLGQTNANGVLLKQSAAASQLRLGDDSDFCSFQTLYQRFGAGSPEGVVTAPVGCLYSRTDGGAGTSLYVKESGTGNTGWVAK